MADKKQVKIGEAIGGEERKDGIKKTEVVVEETSRLPKTLSTTIRRLSNRKDSMVAKKDEKPKTFKDFLADEVKPFRFLSTHFPHYQDHYQYPGYVPFTKRRISETLLESGWDEKQDNDRIRRLMVAERLRRKKRVAKPGIKLKRDMEQVTPLKFDDQMMLSDTLVRRLSGKNPRYPVPLYQWNFRYHEFREISKPCNHHENLFIQPSGLIHIESQEAQWQIEDENTIDEIESESSEESIVEEGEGEEEETFFPVEPLPEEDVTEDELAQEQEEQEEEEFESEGLEGEEIEEKVGEETVGRGTNREIEEKLKFLEDEPPVRFKKSKKLFNLFNFTDRGVQGEDIMCGNKTTQTVPVPMEKLNKYVTSYILYDAYQKDILLKEQKKAKQDYMERYGLTEAEEGGEEEQAESSSEDEVKGPLFNEQTAHRAKILERMVVQNTLFDYTADMKFYEDPIDDFNKEEGSLLPIWTFKRTEFQGLSVTCIMFNPTNPDIFGVTHGSFEFTQCYEKGYLSIYSIKDPLNPEYKKETSEGVTCFDYHPHMKNYIAYATYDGAVHCSELVDGSHQNDPSLHSHPEKGHKSFIWQLKWSPNIEELVFYTISVDGMFFKWNVRNSVIVRSIALSMEYPPHMDVPHLSSPFPFINEITEPVPVQAIATTMEIDPKNNDNVFVGTSDGMVLKCCFKFTEKYLAVYHSHCLPVSRIHFNTYMTTLFITAAEDRKVNIHEDGYSKPLYTFALKNGVVDLMWAPYSSTVFALLTGDCQIVFYDLSINSNKPICQQYILWQYGKTKLTRMMFHPTRPILFVGDSSGTIKSFKISPNLRMKPKKVRRQKQMEPLKMEMFKLDVCLNNTREPDEYPVPADNPRALVDLESDSDDEEKVMIGSNWLKMPHDYGKNDIANIVKQRIFKAFANHANRIK